jgi:excisionase family DNA binding protein
VVDVLTIEEAAEELKVQPKTVREWLRSGRLEGIKAGRLWRIRREEWERFLKASTTPRKAPAGEGEDPGPLDEGWDGRRPNDETHT